RVARARRAARARMGAGRRTRRGAGPAARRPGLHAVARLVDRVARASGGLLPRRHARGPRAPGAVTAAALAILLRRGAEQRRLLDRGSTRAAHLVRRLDAERRVLPRLHPAALPTR